MTEQGTESRVSALEEDGVPARQAVLSGSAAGESDPREPATTPRFELPAGGPGPEPGAGPGTALVFQVVDAHSSEPLTEFDVRVGNRFLIPSTTEDGRDQHHFPDGRVRFTNLVQPSGREGLTLVVGARGYQELRLGDLQPIRGQDLDLGVLRLERSPLVAVRVLDDVSGEPVAGARVTLDEADGGGARLEPDWRRGLTDSEGRVRLNSLPGQLALLTVRHDDYAPSCEELLLPRLDDHEANVRLSAGGSVTIEVADAQGRPVPGVPIYHRSPDLGPYRLAADDSRTDAQGRQTFVHLAEGLHRFRVGSAAMADATWSEIVVSGAGEQTLRLLGPTLSRLTGRVTEDGQPLRGAMLRFVLMEGEELRDTTSERRQDRTDDGGEFALERMQVGTYRVSVSHHTRAMAFESLVEVREGESTLDLDLPVAVIEGMLQGEAGQPLAGMRVQAVRAGAAEAGELGVAGPGAERVFSAADGRYVLRGVACDVDLVVRATGKGYLPRESRVVRLAAGEIESGVDLELAPGAALEVLVVSFAGRGDRKWSVQAIPDRAGALEPLVEQTDSGGVARFACLEPGGWRIRVQEITEPDAESANPALEQTVLVETGRSNHVVFDVD